MQTLVIEASQRLLRCFWAVVTTAPDEARHLVIRSALEVGQLPDLLTANALTGPSVLVIGGYAAKTSAGFVEAYASANSDHHQKVVVVAGMGPGFAQSLRPLRPEPAILIPGPVKFELVAGATNSNFRTASAARDGAAFLAAVDSQSVLLCEGQSDVVKTYRLRAGGRVVDLDIEVDHRGARFTVPALVRASVLARAARGLQGRPGSECFVRHTDEQIAAEAARRIEEFLDRCRPDYTGWEAADPAEVGRGVWALLGGPSALQQVLADLKSGRPAPREVDPDDADADDADDAEEDLAEFAAPAEPAPESELS